jgi:hypothetical protein
MRLTSHAQFRFRFISCCLINKNLEKPNKYIFFMKTNISSIISLNYVRCLRLRSYAQYFRLK